MSDLFNTNKVLILSDSLSPEDLMNLLQPNLSTQNGEITLSLEEEQKGTRALDPIVLAATIKGSAILIAAVVSAFALVYTKNKELSAQIISIKGKNGKEVQFPINAPAEDISFYVDLSGKLGGIEHIAAEKKGA